MTDIADFVEPIRQLHDWIRGLVISACEQQATADLAKVVDDGAGDVTYAIDRVSEEAIVEWFTREIAAHDPIVLVGEGLPNGQITLPRTINERDARWRFIVDPIDGTRGLMYQKRSGWILTGVAPNRGDATSLGDIELAIQSEIPILKQHLCDQAWAIRGKGAQAVRWNRLDGTSQPIALRPSSGSDLRHGFATFCRFFPGGRDILAGLDDELCDRMMQRQGGEAAVFEDQYACTGGQLYGLASGQDRFVADLRPLVHPLLAQRGKPPGHCCHPYDLCTALIAEEAGVIVTNERGEPLRPPLDTNSNVAWIGYANRALHDAVAPVLQQLLIEHNLLSRE